MKGQFRRMAAAVAVTAASLGTVSVFGNGNAGAVSAPLCSGVASVFPGHTHAFALRSDGAAYAWGGHERGQLGIGNPAVDRPTPVAQSGMQNALGIAAGSQFSVVALPTGEVKTAGINSYGQLGDGTQVERRTLVSTGITDAVAVEAGGSHALALAADGTVWAWGRNTEGQLGIGSTTNSLVPVKVSGLSNVTKIAAGWYHSLAVKADGTVWAWGFGQDGQLGNGTRTMATTPVQVTGLSSPTVIDGGVSFSIALLGDGTVRSWGSNAEGQLGNPGAGRTTPGLVPTLSGIVDVAAGSYHAIATDGARTYTWGSNSSGQLGLGDPLPTQERQPNSPVPGEVAGAGGAAQVAAGASSSYAIRSNTLWAWGEGANGQLGNGAIAESNKPVQSGCPTGLTTAPAWNVAMAAEPPVAVPGTPVTVYAVANQDVGPSPYAIQIFDKATGVRLANCTTGVTCTTVVTSPVAATKTYTAYIGTESLTAPPPFTQATAEINVIWGPVGPGPWSTSCDAPTQTVVNNANAMVLVQQISEDETWICFRQSTSANWLGGRVTVIAPSVALPPVTADDQGGACATTPGNQAPGTHPLATHEAGTVDVYANATQAWLCLTTTQSSHRVVVDTQHAPPGVVVNIDGL